MKNLLNAFAFLAFLAISQLASAEIIDTEAVTNEHGRYSAGLLHAILNYREERYTLRPSDVEGGQNRDILNLVNNRLDVIWLISSKSIEDRVRPIRIPIYKGLLGYRILLINQGKQERFDRINTTDELRSITIGQGVNWIDSDILKFNEFNVVSAPRYQYLFSMLEQNRFEAIARGVQEPWAELRVHEDKNFAVETKHVIIYPMPIYFFVNKSNTELASLIETNFNAMIDDGVFDEYFYNFPMIQTALNKAQLGNRVQHHIENPFITQETPTQEKKYWLDLSKAIPKPLLNIRH